MKFGSRTQPAAGRYPAALRRNLGPGLALGFIPVIKRNKNPNQISLADFVIYT